jgi:hypothetical protein
MSTSPGTAVGSTGGSLGRCIRRLAIAAGLAGALVAVIAGPTLAQSGSWNVDNWLGHGSGSYTFTKSGSSSTVKVTGSVVGKAPTSYPFWQCSYIKVVIDISGADDKELTGGCSDGPSKATNISWIGGNSTFRGIKLQICGNVTVYSDPCVQFKYVGNPAFTG